MTVIGVDDRRVRWGRGTGVASFAKMLRVGVVEAGFGLERLVDAPGEGFEPPGRAWRWAAAAVPWAVRAGAPVAGERLAVDVFRRAQVHFDMYGRYLRVRGATPPALMHWSYTLPLRFVGVPNVYSVLDLIPMLQPELTPIDQGRASRLLRRLRREAAHLVTISEASRREIITHLGWPEEQVSNAYLAVDVPAVSEAQMRGACAAVGLAVGGYFLHAGTVERRKNIARLIAAYRASGSTRALVLAGPDGWGAADALAAVAGLLGAPAGGPRVVRIDWLQRADLLGLMRGAAAVLAPSLSEGFGLPVVEAMALGVPSLTSRGGAPEEVTGGAALLVDPADVGEIAAGIRALDADADLRGRLVAAGARRAAVFSAAAYAGRMAGVYDRVLRQSSTKRSAA